MRKVFLSLVIMSALALGAVGCKSSEESAAPAANSTELALESATGQSAANATAE